MDFVVSVSMPLSLMCMIAGFVCNIICAISAVKNCWAVKSIFKANLILKCVQLPMILFWIITAGDVLNEDWDFFGEGEPVTNGVWFVLFLVVVMVIMCIIFGCISSVMSGIVSIAGIVRAKEDDLFSKKAANGYKIGSCIPFVDTVIAIWMWRKVRHLKSGCLQ